MIGDATAVVTRTTFVKNRIGARINGGLTPGDILPCAALNKLTFVRNGVNLDGPRC